MANTVNVLIKADDQASREIDNVSTSAGKLGSVIGDVAKTAAGFLTAQVIGDGFSKLNGFVTGAIDGWKQQLEVTAQTEAVLKSTGGVAGQTADSVLALADSLKKNSLFADDAIQSGENLLLTFTNIGQDIFPDATQTMLDMSQALGQDLSSSAIQLGKALNDPVQGVTALRRVGVSFNDAQLDQIKAMQESGDLMGAQKLILAELSKEFGGSAKAASDAAGASAKLDDKMDDLQDTLGAKLLPIQLKFKEAQIAFIDVLLKALPAVEQFGDAAIKAFGQIHEFIGNFIGDVKWLIENGSEFNDTISTGIWQDMAKGIAHAVEVMKSMKDAAAELFHLFELGFSGGEIGGSFNLLQEAAFKTGEALAMLRDAASDMWDKLQPILADIGAKIEEALGGNKTEILQAIGIALGVIAGEAIISGIIALTSAVVAFGVALVVSTGGLILLPAALAAVALGIIELIKHWDDITQRFPQLGEAADFVQLQISKFTDWVQATLIPAVRNIADTVADTFRAVEGFASEHWGQITNIFQGALDIVLAVVTNELDLIVVVFQGAFEILHGIITVFHGLFTGDWQEMWDGIKMILDGAVDIVTGTLGNMKDVILEVGAQIKDGLTAALKAAGSAAVEEMSHMKDGALDKLDDLRLGILSTGQGIVNALGDVFGRAKDWVGVQFSGLADVVKQPINAAIGFINALIAAWDGLHFSIGEHSFLGVKIPGISFGTPYIPPIQPLAKGGIVTRPTLAMIGEAGREAVIPLDRAGGMGGNVYHINVASLDPRTAADLVLKTLVDLERRGGVTPGVTRALA